VEWLTVTFGLYKQVISRAAVLAAKNWPVMGSVLVYSVVMSVTAELAMMLGFAGGFVITLVWAACVSSFLFLVEMMVRTSKVSLDDFRRSFLVYLGDVVGVMFLFWIFSFFAGPVLRTLPNGPLILMAIYLGIFVFFNAVPELIYLGHHSSLALLAESYSFISANWVEWFPATLVASAVVYAFTMLPFGGLAAIVQHAIIGLLVYFTMVMRGLLFIQLAGSSRRSRAFRHRAGGN
jgi:hypothetical protein